MTFFSRRSTAALIAAALLFGACGGGDDDAATTTSPAGTPTSGTPASAASGGSTAGGADSDAEGALAKIGGDPFCKEIGKVALNLDTANPGDYFEALAGLAKNAPDEIKDDLTLLAESGAVLADPTQAKPEDAAKLKAVTDAGTALDEWTKANCTGMEAITGG